MKTEPEFVPFVVDPSWYGKYWYEPEPAKPAASTQRLRRLAALLRRLRQQAAGSVSPPAKPAVDGIAAATSRLG